MSKLTSADTPGLTALNKLRSNVSLNLDLLAFEPTVDFSGLPPTATVFLHGSELTQLHASQLKHIHRLGLDVEEISIEAIEAFGSDPPLLSIENFHGSAALARAITCFSGKELCLSNCNFPEGFQIAPEPGQVISLCLIETHIPDDKLVDWLRKSRVVNLTLSGVECGTSRLELLKQVPSLRKIHYWLAGECHEVDLPEVPQEKEGQD